MLNKIKIIGKILLKENEEKELGERKNDNFSAPAQETAKDDKSQPKPESEKEKREPWFYFSMLVPNPSGSITILRCVAQGENAERINKEVKKDEVIEIRGYLRNEKDSRQILIRSLEFDKLDLSFEEVDKENANQVRLMGKIITDLQPQESQKNSEILSFKLSVPREGVKSPLFFCRAHGELITEINNKLKKGDIILLEGFLQTKKIEDEVGEGTEKNFSRISSIICRGFTFLDNDSVRVFSPLDNLTRVVKDIGKIDFTKPKSKQQADELEIN
jgi:single-stranded DNA-binding protein